MTVAGPPADFLSRLAARTLGLGPTGTPRIPSIFEPPPAPSGALDLPEDAETVPSPPPVPDVEPAAAIPVLAPTILAPAPAAPALAPASSAPAVAAPALAPASPAPAVAAERGRNGAPRIAQAAEATTGVAAAASTSLDEAEPPAGEPRRSPSAAAPAVSVRALVPGSRPTAAATPPRADREPNPAEARPVLAAAPAPRERPMTFATPLAVPFAPPDRSPPIAPSGAIAFLPRRERRLAFNRDAAAPEGPSVNITIGRVEVRAAAPAAAEPRAAARPRGAAPQSLADYLKRRDRVR